MIEARELNAFYGKQHVLHEINFIIKKGELTSLLGTNGAGKSSLVNTLLNTVNNTGSLIYKEKDIKSWPTHKRVQEGLVLIPEGRQLFSNMTISDHLSLAVGYKNKSDKSFSLEQVYNLFPRLKEREKQFARTLSGGERQMLAIARGLLLGPELLILDEPSLGLSPKISKDVFDVIAQLKTQGLTILLIEQNVHSALKLSDRIYFLESGSISKPFSSSQLSDSPQLLQQYLGQ